MVRKIILIGKNEINNLGDGWYGLEKSPEGMYYRAASPTAAILLPLGMKKISLSMILSARPQHAGEPLRLEIFSKPNSYFKFSLETNIWSICHGELDVEGCSEILVKTKNPWCPDNLYHNGDTRALSILLNAVRIEDIKSVNHTAETIWKTVQSG